MHKQSLLRRSLILALVASSVAWVVSPSYAAMNNPNPGGNTGGPSRSSPNPGGPSNPGGGGGGSGAGMPDAIRVLGPNDCPPGVASCHRKPKPPVVRFKARYVDQQRCTSRWRLV